MNITHSDVENGILTATVTIPAADVDNAVKKAYRDVAKKYNFHGFRPGKAPASGHRQGRGGPNLRTPTPPRSSSPLPRPRSSMSSISFP